MTISVLDSNFRKKFLLIFSGGVPSQGLGPRGQVVIIVVGDVLVLRRNFEGRISSSFSTKLISIVLPSVELTQAGIETVGQSGRIPLAIVESMILIVVNIIGIKFSSLIISKSGLVTQMVGVKDLSLVKGPRSHGVSIFA